MGSLPWGGRFFLSSMRWPRGVRPTVGKSTDWVSPQRSQGGHKGHKGDFDGFDGLVALVVWGGCPTPRMGRCPLDPGRGKLPLHRRHVCDVPVWRRKALLWEAKLPIFH